MRIIFVNLHSDWMLLKTSSVFVYKFSPAIKHGYILKYLLDHPEKFEVCNYINDRGFSLLSNGNRILLKFLNLFSGLENRIILKKNGISPKKIKVLRNLSDIRKDDIVIMYNIHSNHYRGMSGVNAFKALSVLHFHGYKSDNDMMEESGIDCYFNETNLSKTSKLWQTYFTVQRPWIVIPFVFAERFRVLKPFPKRQNKAFAVGTITYKLHKDYLDVYGEPCLQPMRKIIKDSSEYYKGTIDCYSEDYLEGDEGKKVKDSDNKLVVIYKKIYNRFHLGQQKKYFSFDMVEKFNDYKMCIVAEEALGLPGIGFVEGMACGCAYIGLDSPMYRDYGLIPGVHYISYDGTKEGLRQTIEYYQKPDNQNELERIADAGCKFVRKKFRGDVVAEKLLNELINLRNEKQTNK